MIDLCPKSESTPDFTEEQIKWMEDRFVNHLCPVYIPEKRKRQGCWLCIKKCEELFAEIRGLRGSR